MPGTPNTPWLVEVRAAGGLLVLDSAAAGAAGGNSGASMGAANGFLPARVWAAISICRCKLGVSEIAVVRIRLCCSLAWLVESASVKEARWI